MVEIMPLPGTLLLLHGLMGGWDELVLMAGGVLLAIFVVKWTSRSSRTDDEDDEIAGTIDGTTEKRADQD